MTSNIFADDFSLGAFLKFRAAIEKGNDSEKRLFIDARNACPFRAAAVAGWLPQLQTPWEEFSSMLSAGLAGEPDTEFVLPYQAHILPGGLGRVLMLRGALPADESGRREILDAVAKDQAAGRWWCVWAITAGLFIEPAKRRGVVVKLAPTVF